MTETPPSLDAVDFDGVGAGVADPEVQPTASAKTQKARTITPGLCHH
jgi:hypothetical protein